MSFLGLSYIEDLCPTYLCVVKANQVPWIGIQALDLYSELMHLRVSTSTVIFLHQNWYDANKKERGTYDTVKDGAQAVPTSRSRGHSYQVNGGGRIRSKSSNIQMLVCRQIHTALPGIASCNKAGSRRKCNFALDISPPHEETKAIACNLSL